MIQNKWRKQIAKAGLSQAELSRRTGVPNTSISLYANGMGHPVKEEEARKLCDALGCTLGSVYGADELRVLYGIGADTPPPKPKRKRIDTRVRIDAALWAELTERAERAQTDLPMLVNRLLLREVGAGENGERAVTDREGAAVQIPADDSAS